MSAGADQKFWLAVACADHVARGLAGGFMQVCHGKGGPLRRLKPGDGVVYYSPTKAMGVKDGLQSFTAIGTVADGEPYQADMGGGFLPFRRDVVWRDACPVRVQAMAGRLQLTTAPNWGYSLRFGLLPFLQGDYAALAEGMCP